jgi:hypothetical protein
MKDYLNLNKFKIKIHYIICNKITQNFISQTVKRDWGEIEGYVKKNGALKRNMSL